MNGSPRRLRLLSLALLVLAAAGTAMAFGGALREGIIGAALAGLVALTAAAWRARVLSLDAFGALLLGMTLVTALQLVPLPSAVVEALAPTTAAIRAGAAQALGQDAPTTMPLSLDTEATRLMVLWWLAVAAIYMTARRLARREEHEQHVLLAVPLIGLLLVAIGLGHAVLAADRVYGIYQPSPGVRADKTATIYLSTFLNPNHLAAYLNLGAPIALAMTGVERLTHRARILWLCCFLILIIGMALTGSRAGILTGGLAALLVFAGQRPGGLRRYGLLAAAIIVGFLALVSPLGRELSSIPGVGQLLDATDRGMHQLGFAVIERWPWTGVGRGAFAVASTQVEAGPAHMTVTHAHNTPLQLLADYGIILGSLALVLVVALLAGPAWRAMSKPLHRGAAAGLLAVALHNLVDFNLDILGVALGAAMIAGVLRVGRSGARLPWRAVSFSALATTAAVVVAIPAIGVEPGPRRDRWILANPVAAAHLHPADAYAFLGAGLETGDLSLLEHAERLNPSEPRTHLALAALGPESQRLDRIALALQQRTAYRLRQRAFTLIGRYARTGADVLRALGDDPTTVAQYIRWERQPKEPVLRRAVARFPESPEVLAAVAARRLSAGQLDEVDDLATQLMILEDPQGYRLMGQVMARRGDHRLSYHMYLEAGDPESLLAAAEQALAAGERLRAIELLDTAEVGPEHLKRLRALRTRAMGKGLLPHPSELLPK